MAPIGQSRITRSLFFLFFFVAFKTNNKTVSTNDL